MNYRRDIDGLRAVAVVPVVIYHIAQSYMPGGFVGVDIFFVISGYLISNNILRMIEQGNFRFLDFYERRLRRIAPAYLVVMGFCTAVMLVYAYPKELNLYIESLYSSLLSVSNIYLYFTNGYFTLQAEEVPLLHTWSLSVEEQFYIIFPILALLPLRYFLSLRVFIVVLAFALSLICSIVVTHFDPGAAFYLLPTRAWELLMGTILALKVLPVATRSMARHIIGVAGTAMIAFAMFAFSNDTPFPGAAALVPCLGAAMLLYVGESGDNLVSRLLAWRLPVFFGAISYSLYLWHWPVLVFQKSNNLFIVTDSKLIERSVVLALSILFATLSLYLVERVTRDRTMVSTKALVRGVVLAILPLAAVGVLAFATNGLPGRFSAAAVRLAEFREYGELPTFRSGACFLGDKQRFEEFNLPLCLPKEHNEAIVLLGDSHAAALYPGLVAAFPDQDILQLTGVRCVPTIVSQPRPGAACRDMIEYAINVLPKTRKVSAYILAARWNVGSVELSSGFNRDWMGDIATTVGAIGKGGAKALVIGPMPEYRWALPQLLANAVELNDPLLAQKNLSGGSLLLDGIMGKFMREHSVPYVSLASYLCSNGKCREFAEPGIPLLFDNSHLTPQGSKEVARGAIFEEVR